MDGLLVIDKPVGPTSHDVVVRVRALLGERRVGHTGTLDPAASGVLPLVVGRATRLARFLSAVGKSYEATIRLGAATDTWDGAGTPIGRAFHGPFPGREAIDRTLDAFRGTFQQQPPVYSAKKIGGRRSHRLARAASALVAATGAAGNEGPRHRDTDTRAAALAGVAPERGSPGATGLHSVEPAFPAPVSVTVHALELGEVDGSRVTLRVDCSAGFYVRGLAHELGRRLGIGAHLEALRRVRSGDVTLDQAISLATLALDPEQARTAMIPLSSMLLALTALTLTPEGLRRAGHGQDLGAAAFEAGQLPAAVGDGVSLFRLLDMNGNLVGVAERMEACPLLHPAVVLM